MNENPRIIHSPISDKYLVFERDRYGNTIDKGRFERRDRAERFRSAMLTPTSLLVSLAFVGCDLDVSQTVEIAPVVVVAVGLLATLGLIGCDLDVSQTVETAPVIVVDAGDAGLLAPAISLSYELRESETGYARLDVFVGPQLVNAAVPTGWVTLWIVPPISSSSNMGRKTLSVTPTTAEAQYLLEPEDWIDGAGLYDLYATYSGDTTYESLSSLPVTFEFAPVDGGSD